MFHPPLMVRWVSLVTPRTGVELLEVEFNPKFSSTPLYPQHWISPVLNSAHAVSVSRATLTIETLVPTSTMPGVYEAAAWKPLLSPQQSSEPLVAIPHVSPNKV